MICSLISLALIIKYFITSDPEIGMLIAAGLFAIGAEISFYREDIIKNFKK